MSKGKSEWVAQQAEMIIFIMVKKKKKAIFTDKSEL